MAQRESRVRFVSWTQFGQLLGAFSIAGSLLLVAWELKQARDIAEAELHLGRANFDAKGYLEFDQVKIGQATNKLKALGEEGLEDEEWYLLWSYYHFLHLGVDTAHFHWQRGLLGKEVLHAYLEAYDFGCNPNKVEFGKKVWSGGRGYRKEFAQVINNYNAEKAERCRQRRTQGTVEASPAPEQAGSAPKG